MYKVDVTPVVGLPQFSGWSQIASSYHNSGQLVCAFAVIGDHAGNVGRDLTEKITAAQVESAADLHKFINELLEVATQLGVEVKLAAGVFKLNKIIMGVAGGSVFLKRASRTGVLLTSNSEIKIIEGKHIAGDIVVLATTQASDFLSEIEQKFLSGYDSDSVVTSIIPGLHGLDDSSLSSLAFISGGQEFKDSSEDEIGGDKAGKNQADEDENKAGKNKAGKNKAGEDVVDDDDVGADEAVTKTKIVEEEKREKQSSPQLSQGSFLLRRENNQAAATSPTLPKNSVTTANSLQSKDSWLNIPLALRLRGAGKKRTAKAQELQAAQIAGVGVSGVGATQRRIFGGSGVGVAAQTAKNLKADMSELGLSRLGQAQGATHLSQAGLAFLTQFGQKIWSGLSKLFLLIKKINWEQLLAKLLQQLESCKNFFTQKFHQIVLLFRKLTAKDIYLKTKSPRYFYRVVLPIVIGIMVIGGLIIFQLIKTKKQTQAAQAALTPITARLVLAQEQVGTDLISSRETVAQVITQLEQLDQDFVTQKKARALVQVELEKARGIFEQISGQEEFGQLEIFYDLRLVDGEFVVSNVAATKQEVALLDADRKQVIVLNLAKKQVKKMDFATAARLVDLKLTNQTLTLLGEGIFEQALDTASGETAGAELGEIAQAKPSTTSNSLTEIIASGDSNKTATLLERFATYVYVFNPEKRNIYRYAKQKDGYSEPIGWMSGAVSFDYQQVSSWAIDGDIWVTTREGGLYRLVSGRQEQFEPVGLTEPFKHNLQVVTNEDLENLYLLEPAGKRVVVLTKEGEFLKEIKSDSLASTTTLFVSEELKKAFAVSGSIIYALEI